MDALKPKPFFETLMACAFPLGYASGAFWFIVLFFFLMPGYDIRRVLFQTVYLSGLTIILAVPIAAYYVRDIRLEIAVTDRQSCEERLVAVLFGLGYAKRTGTDNTAVFELSRGFALWRWPIGVVFADTAATVVGPAATVRRLVSRYNGAQG